MAKHLTEREVEIEGVTRRIGATLGIWALCRKAPCRRTQGCHGDDARVCFGRYCHMLPEGVRDWFLTLGEGQAAGVPFDQTWKELDRLGLHDALAEWHETVGQVNGGRKGAQHGRSDTSP